MTWVAQLCGGKRIRGLCGFKGFPGAEEPAQPAAKPRQWVPLFPGRRVSEWSAMKRDSVLPAEALAEAGRAIPSALIRQIQTKIRGSFQDRRVPDSAPRVALGLRRGLAEALGAKAESAHVKR